MAKISKIKIQGVTHEIKDNEAYVKPASGIPASDIANGVIPDVSAFITKSVNDLTNYYTKSQTYTQTEVNNLISAINQFKYEIAASTSDVTSPQNNVLYLIGPTGSGTDKYEEYVYPNSTTDWVKIGDTSIDLSGYVTTTALNTALASYTTTSNLTTLLSAKVDKVSGKGLSTNDYTTNEKNKLSGIEEGAQENKIEHIQINGTEQTITNKTVNLPAYPTTLPASDVYDWAKAATKPSYSFSEIEGTVADSQLPDTISSDITGTAMGLKTEKLTDQEFVFRKSPNTIKAKSLTLDRIQGKTRVWNQLVRNGNFQQGTGSWSAGSGVTMDVSNGVVTVTKKNSSSSSTFVAQNINIVSGHKYYLSFILNSPTVIFKIGFFSAPTQWIENKTYQANEDTHISSIIQADSDKTRICIGPYSFPSGSYTLRNVMLIDLTLLYGTEIDGLTDDEILAKFESQYPLPYYETNNGSLINNDASALETAGFNQWNEEWGNHTWNNYGNKSKNPSAIGSNDIIPVLPETEYYIKTPYRLIIQNFTSSGVIRSSIGGNVKYITPSGTYGITINTYITDGITTYNNGDICINLSDPAKNGTYEPYRKSTMQLNLGSFQVRDSQGNVTTITGGLKSAGDVKDEIVGNKYIKRVESVDLGTLDFVYNSTYQYFQIYQETANSKNFILAKYINRGNNSSITDMLSAPDKSAYYRIPNNRLLIKDSAYTDEVTFKTAMSGVMLYYALATPEEYELVNPLIPTMKAGITEARISSNADGLSAPMVCDATYSVGYEYIEGEIGNIQSILQTI